MAAFGGAAAAASPHKKYEALDAKLADLEDAMGAFADQVQGAAAAAGHVQRLAVMSAGMYARPPRLPLLHCCAHAAGCSCVAVCRRMCPYGCGWRPTLRMRGAGFRAG